MLRRRTVAAKFAVLNAREAATTLRICATSIGEVGRSASVVIFSDVFVELCEVHFVVAGDL